MQQCCNPNINGGGGWGIFNALLGWQNSATYGSVISYNLYWITVMIGFIVMRISEKRGGLFRKRRAPSQISESEEATSSGEEDGLKYPEKSATGGTNVHVKTVSK